MFRNCISSSTRISRKLFLEHVNKSNVSYIHTTAARPLFWEPHRKGGYDTESKDPVSNLEHIRLGFKQIKHEIALWKDEIKEKMERDPWVYYQMGVVDPVWVFDNETVLEKFITTSDSDHNEGYSYCSLKMSPAGRALFSGYIDKVPPKDGRTKRAGYCNMRSMRVRKSFKRDSAFDWTMYNTLVMKIRGDGRPYMLNLSLEGFYDINWNDMYNYVLYTRGGPYWQSVKIPFSKFLFSAKGRIQDQQCRIPLNKVTHFGITCAQDVTGPFSLEIEFVGLEFDPEHQEDFAYELYQTDRYLIHT